MWSSPNIKYFVDWKVQVWNNGKLLKEEILNLENKKVLIRFDSKSLGDSIAWIPYVEEFKNKHKCEVYCATFKNFLFKKSYSQINFVNINEDESNYYASYKIGWYYNKNENPNDVRIIPLQRASSDILGLNYKEIRAKIDFTPKLKENPIGKYVTLSIQSTSQCKYWNKIDGWDKVVKYLNKHGYKVVCIDQYNNFGIKNLYNHIPKNAIDFTGKPLEEILELIHHSKFHIGVSSGISWVSWALNKKTVIVSSFSDPICEFTEDCYRVYKDTEYSGYFNNINYRFDPSKWNWNPFKEMKTLSEWDEFETIEFEDVKVELDKLI
jgi:autotransporter strand-loop-strand O-heptosyltransferase